MIKEVHMVIVTDDNTVHRMSLAVTRFEANIGKIEVTKIEDKFRSYKPDGSAHIIIEGRKIEPADISETLENRAVSD